jgi:hypothetical protein
MQARTLERLRWLSVLCLMGAAMCSLLVERRTNAVEAAWAHVPSPAPGMPVKAALDVRKTSQYQLQMDMPLPVAARHDVHFSDLPPQPAGLRLSIGGRRGAAKTVDIRELRFYTEFAWGGIATYSSEPFWIASGRQEIEISATDDRLPPGRALSLVEIGEGSGFLIMQDFMRFFGWLALGIGAALWIALAFARRYAASDVPR